jgi:hypothetical protein
MKRTTGLIGNHSKMIILSNANKTVWSYMLTSNVLTSLQKNNTSSLLSVYPNPSKSKVVIELEQKHESRSYHLRDLKGRLIQTGQTPSTHLFSLDLSQLNNGTYYLNIDELLVRLIKD